MREVIDGEESEAVPVDSGVPKGTVPGPLLFLCHISGLQGAVKSTVRLFADDCLLYRQIKSREDHISLQQDQNLETRTKAWGMRFNAKKCYIIGINSKPTHSYQLDGHILQEVQENPYICIQNRQFNTYACINMQWRIQRGFRGSLDPPSVLKYPVKMK